MLHRGVHCSAELQAKHTWTVLGRGPWVRVELARAITGSTSTSISVSASSAMLLVTPASASAEHQRQHQHQQWHCGVPVYVHSQLRTSVMISLAVASPYACVRQIRGVCSKTVRQDFKASQCFGGGLVQTDREPVQAMAPLWPEDSPRVPPL
jgi:hypothetical protein